MRSVSVAKHVRQVRKKRKEPHVVSVGVESLNIAPRRLRAGPSPKGVSRVQHRRIDLKVVGRHVGQAESKLKYVGRQQGIVRMHAQALAGWDKGAVGDQLAAVSRRLRHVGVAVHRPRHKIVQHVVDLRAAQSADADHAELPELVCRSHRTGNVPPTISDRARNMTEAGSH